MKPVLFEGHDAVLGAPQGWDATKEGECAGLPVMRHDGRCTSIWELTVEERAAIAAGAHLMLSVFSGETQPPVWMAVGRPPQQTIEHFPVIVVGDGTTTGTNIIDAQTKRSLRNVKRFAVSADANTGELRAYIEVIGERAELGGDALPVSSGLKCMALVMPAPVEA